VAYHPGHRWTSEEATPWNPPSGRAFNLAITAALGGAGLYATTRPLTSGGRVIDDLQRIVRHAASSTPWSFGNTFGAAEWMSPFVSSGMQGAKKYAAQQFMGPGGKLLTRDVVGVHWGKDVLGAGETEQVVRKFFGGETFDKLGINRGFGDEGFELLFERDARSAARGSLFARKGTKGLWELVSSAASLFETTPVSAKDVAQAAQVGLKQPKMTPAYQSVLQAGGFFKEWSPNQFRRVFSDSVSGEISRFMPMPSVGGPLRNLSDLSNRSTYFRSLYAFGAQRLNRLIGTTMDQLPLLGGVAQSFEKHLGMSLAVRPGTGMEMFTRFGIKGAQVGGAILAVKQLDWIRRQGGLPGHALVSGGMAAGAAALTKKFGGSQRASMMVGVGAFFGQMLLPGFDKGTGQGIADTWATGQVGLAAVGKFTGLNIYRRTLEGFAPGITDWKTSAFAGLSLAAAGYLGLPAHLVERYGQEPFRLSGILDGRIGFQKAALEASSVKGAGIVGLSARDRYWSSVHNVAINEGYVSAEKANQIMEGKLPKTVRRNRLFFAMQKSAKEQGRWGALMDRLQLERSGATAQDKAFLENNPLNASLQQSLKRIDKHYSGRTGFVARAARVAESFSSRAMHGFFGANLSKELVGQEYLTRLFEETGFKPRIGRLGVLFAAGAAAHRLLTTGGIGSLENPSDLMDIYSGKQQIEVRASRFWEGGGGDIEGGETKYMRPHRFALWRSRASERARWGEDEDSISPLGKFLRKNFTYELERRNYWNRPHTITGSAFEDVPMIGPALAATIGRVIKPPKLMHVPDWVRTGQGDQLEFAHAPEYKGPNYELGGLTPGKPMSPYTPGFVAGASSYRFREMEGLTGFLSNVITKKLTGSETFFSQRSVLSSASSITDLREAFWGMDLGGAFFTSELARRFLPRIRPEVDEYNPILNTMPSWLPQRYKMGDPYRTIPDADVRLPGAGYQAIHPELRGVDPEKYPIAYRYAILADVADWSPEFRTTRAQIYKARAAGLTGRNTNDFIDLIDTRLNKKLIGDGFLPTHDNAIEVPLLSEATQAAWHVGQRSLRAIVEPAEYMMPFGFRPMSKLMGNRDAIEEYERTNLYGTNMAFWDKPVRDWFRPAAYQAANLMGYRGIPGHVEETRQTDEYFDKLEFMKWMTIAQKSQGNEKRQALYRAQQTRFGVNPQGNPLGIYAAMPEGEKKFYDAFTFAQGEDRQRILEMVPTDQAHLYQTVWERMDRGDPGLHAGSATQVNEAYLASRFNELQGYFYDKPLPSEDWIGHNADVDLRDIKIKYTDDLGRDVHEYGGWQRDVRMLARKPYLEGSTDFLYQDHPLHRDSIGELMYNLPRSEHQRGSRDMSVHGYWGGQTQAQLHYNDSRESDILSLLARAM